MGNESSTLVDENTSPSVLEARNIDAVAKYVKEKKVRRVVVMVCYPTPHEVWFFKGLQTTDEK